MFEPGHTICGGRFRIEALIGKGAVGSVYRAFDQEAERLVALKVVRRDGASESGPERFRREGEITAALKSPGIVSVHDFGQEPEFSWLAYELVEGARTLEDVSGLPLRARVELLAAVADAVGYAHSQGVVHRDLKPANVLVTRDGRIRVADFGLAAARGLSRLTRTGAIVGSPAYMAPEQFEGKQSRIGPGTDVWALGVVLYELLTGRMPFAAETFWELAAQINSQRPAPPSELDPSGPVDLEDVCFRALERQPSRRHPDGGAFASDLRCWLVGEAISAETRGARVPRRPRWPLLLLFPLAGLGATLALLDRAPSPDPEPPAPVTGAAPAPPRSARSTWRPRVGEQRWIRMHFVSQTIRPSVTKTRRVEFELEERIDSVSGSEVAISCVIRRVRVEYGLLNYDSRTPDAGLHAPDSVEGTPLSYRIDLGTGEVYSLEGLDTLGGVGLQQLVGEASENLTDEQLARHQRALLAVLPPRGFEAADAWERRVTLWPTAFSGFELRCRARREGDKTSLAMIDAQVVKGPRGARIFDIKARGGGRYDASRWSRAWWRLECVQQQAEDRARVVWELAVDQLPPPAERRSE